MRQALLNMRLMRFELTRGIPSLPPQGSASAVPPQPRQVTNLTVT